MRRQGQDLDRYKEFEVALWRILDRFASTGKTNLARPLAQLLTDVEAVMQGLLIDAELERRAKTNEQQWFAYLEEHCEQTVLGHRCWTVMTDDENLTLRGALEFLLQQDDVKRNLEEYERADDTHDSLAV